MGFSNVENKENSVSLDSLFLSHQGERIRKNSASSYPRPCRVEEAELSADLSFFAEKNKFIIIPNYQSNPTPKPKFFRRKNSASAMKIMQCQRVAMREGSDIIFLTFWLLFVSRQKVK